MVARYGIRGFLREVLLWLVALVLIGFPLYLLVNTALKPRSDRSPGARPTRSPTLENFRTAWQGGDLGVAFLTSVVITAASVAGIVVLSSLAGYAIARSTRAWSKVVFGLFLAGIIIPGLGMIPLYATLRDLGLLGTVQGLVIIYIGGGMPFNVFLYAIFLRSVPRDFEEAAMIDGCGRLRMFWYVVFPLMRPVTGTVVILAAIYVYNDFFLPLLLLSGSGVSTVPLALRNFSSQYFTDWGAIFAALIISIAPVLIFYLFLQKSIIKGFAGGLKG